MTTLNELKIDHVAVAARSFDDVLPVLERLAGGPASKPKRVKSQGVDVCFAGFVEVIVPIDSDSGVARFVERRGTALHHIAYRVPDLANAMKALSAEGYEFTSREPVTGAEGHRIAFIHPRSAGGLLVELVEK